MKIGIIGLGVVGTANQLGFQSLGHQVFVHDIKLETTINNVLETDIIFICVPTPNLDIGKCDTSAIESTVSMLDSLDYVGVIAIRSTVVPGFTEQMILKYVNRKVCFVPEFLRERCALEDFLNNKILAVGTTNDQTYDIVCNAFSGVYSKAVRLSPTESELLKYFNNTHAALKITFANIMYELCDQLNCNYDLVKDTYVNTGKTVDMYLDANEELRGYGGVCLPKDVLSLNYFFQIVVLLIDYL